MTTHRIPEPLLERRVNVALVGAGGTGSQVLTGLARLDAALRALDHPGGLAVTVYDPDVVTRSNVGRQLFSPADIGCPKAHVLVHRLNCWYGLDWEAVSAVFDKQSSPRPDIVISCVDTAAARRSVLDMITTFSVPYYWLDCGNRQHDGQVILGEINAFVYDREAHAYSTKSKKPLKLPARLPHVIDLYPEIANKKLQEDNAPSCSMAESLEKQDLFVNDHVSRWALHLLWTLFRSGRIEHHGYLINLVDGVVNPIPVPGAKANG